MKYGLLAVMALMFSGCATDQASAHIGAYGSESILSGNKVSGLYLFKIQTHYTTINVNARDAVKVGL